MPRRIRRIVTWSLSLCASVSACRGDRSVAREDLRCEIRTTASVNLLADTTVTFDQPDMYNFAVDSRGEVYASTVRGGALIHWDSDGTMLPMLGTMGEGPGQFAGGSVAPYMVPGDTVYARDNHQHWVVYGPDHRFVRFAPVGPIVAGFPTATQFMRNGLVLSADQNGNEHYSLLVVNRVGEVVRRLRPIPKAEAGKDHIRAAVAADDGSFWLGPEVYSRGGYSVQHWDSTGNLIGTVHRSVPWFIADSLIRPSGKSGPGGGRRERPFLYPRVQQLAVDSSGLLWVVTRVPRTADAREAIFGAKDVFEKAAISLQVLETHVEVIDASDNVVIASRVFPSGFLLMPNGRDAVQVTEDSATGLRQAVRMVLRVRGSSGAGCH
jgi:hypothetical protein